MQQIEATGTLPSTVSPAANEALAAIRRHKIEALLKEAQGGNRERILAQLREMTGFAPPSTDTAKPQTAVPAAGPKARLYAAQIAPAQTAAAAAPSEAASDLPASPVDSLTGGTTGNRVFQRAYRQKLDDMVGQTARRHGLDPNLVKAMVAAASDFDPKHATSGGAMGLLGLSPTAVSTLGMGDPTDPSQNLEGGAKLLAALKQRFGGSEGKAVAAFWWDPEQVAQGAPLPSRLRGMLDKVAGLRSLYAHGFSARA